MTKARVLLDQKLNISERFRVELKVFEVEPREKHPEGVRVRFALIDVLKKAPRLLIDNHAPFGFHVHNELPGNKDKRQILKSKDYQEALDEFWGLVQEITNNET